MTQDTNNSAPVSVAEDFIEIIRENDTNLSKIKEEYHQYNNKKNSFIIITSFLLFIALILGMTLGAAEMSFTDVLNVIFSEAEPMYEQIIWRIRLPRVLSAALAGMALALSGVAMQNVLKNSLASPFTLGISHAAAFGAAFSVVVFGAGSMHSTYSDAVVINNPYIVTISSFICCLITTFLIILMVKIRNAQPRTIILMGIVLSSLFSSGSTAIQYFADEVQLAAIVHWSFGDLSQANWVQFYLLLAITGMGCIYFIRNAWTYNILDAGDEVAKSLGVDIEKKRIGAMIVASMLTAVAISFFGIIAYVGLVVPHIVRRVVGNEGKHLMIATTLFGGLFLLVADTIARTILSPIVLPVGIVTSFLGAPLFLYLLLRKKERF